MKKIVITREIFDDAIALLEQHFSVISNQQDKVIASDVLAGMLQGADGVQTQSGDRIDGEFFFKFSVITTIGL